MRETGKLVINLWLSVQRESTNCKKQQVYAVDSVVQKNPVAYSEGVEGLTPQMTWLSKNFPPCNLAYIMYLFLSLTNKSIKPLTYH